MRGEPYGAAWAEPTAGAYAIDVSFKRWAGPTEVRSLTVTAAEELVGELLEALESIRGTR